MPAYSIVQWIWVCLQIGYPQFPFKYGLWSLSVWKLEFIGYPWYSISMTHHDTSISGFYRPMNFWDFGISGPKLSETRGRGSFWVRLHAEPISSQSMRVWESSQAKSKRSAISRENVWILGSYWDPIGILYDCIIFPVCLYHILAYFISIFGVMFGYV